MGSPNCPNQKLSVICNVVFLILFSQKGRSDFSVSTTASTNAIEAISNKTYNTQNYSTNILICQEFLFSWKERFILDTVKQN